MHKSVFRGGYSGVAPSSQLHPSILDTTRTPFHRGWKGFLERWETVSRGRLSEGWRELRRGGGGGQGKKKHPKKKQRKPQEQRSHSGKESRLREQDVD